MSNFWSSEEVSILIREYPSKGAQGCLPLINGRSRDAIQQKARKLNIIHENSPVRLKTHTQYEEDLFNKEIDYMPIESYINTATPILHECIKGHQWKASPNNILRGWGCPDCSGLKKLTTKQYESRLPVDIKLLQPYINYETKILHKHTKCGREWLARPHDILGKGSGCPSCNIIGVYKQPTTLYHVKFNNYYKIGITTKSNVKQRFSGEWDSLGMSLIWELRFPYGIIAYKLEQQLLRNYKHLLINTGILKGGNTETILEEIPCPV